MKRSVTSDAAEGTTRQPRSRGSLLAALRRGLASGHQLPPGLILLEDPRALQETLAEWQALLLSGEKDRTLSP